VRVVEKSVALRSLTLVKGASLAAPDGKAMTVDGAAKAIKTGGYKGKIVLKVTKS